MTKNTYMKPVMRTVELKHRTTILTGSEGNYGMSKSLHNEEEVEEAM